VRILFCLFGDFIIQCSCWLSVLDVGKQIHIDDDLLIILIGGTIPTIATLFRFCNNASWTAAQWPSASSYLDRNLCSIRQSFTSLLYYGSSNPSLKSDWKHHITYMYRKLVVSGRRVDETKSVTGWAAGMGTEEWRFVRGLGSLILFPKKWE